jgi:hypothetical protein
MLDAYPLNPILPAQDGPRAEAFYRDKLGLEQLSPAGADPRSFRAGNDTTIALTELPDRVPPAYPVIAFMVSDIEKLMRDLAAREVTFLEPGISRFRGREGTVEGAITDWPREVSMAARQRREHPRAKRGRRESSVKGSRGGESGRSGQAGETRPTSPR